MPRFHRQSSRVIRYSTPSIGAVGISGSFARDFWDGQISTSGQLGASSYSLRASYAVDGDDSDNTPAKDTYSLAAAIKVGGVSVNTLFGSVEHDNMTDSGDDMDGFGIKLAYDFGDSGVGLLFRETDVEGSADPSTWGVGVQHSMLGVVDIFAGYYVYDPNTGADETKTFSVGSRIKF